MRLVIWGLVIATVFAGSALVGMAARQWVSPAPARPLASAARGEMLYTIHCAKCHGPEGHGDGEGAEKLVPPPRNFARRPWRFEPTADSIERVVTSGIGGTSMPSFQATLLEADIQAVAQYVLKLSETSDSEETGNDLFAAAKFFPLKSPRGAPALELQAADGSERTLADLRGRWVILNFWGASCEHCLAKMPQLAELQAKFDQQGLTVVNVCADEDDASAAQNLLTKAAPTMTTYVDPSGLANSRYEVSLMPTIWLINPRGELVAKAQGAPNWTDPKLIGLLESLLAEETGDPATTP